MAKTVKLVYGSQVLDLNDGSNYYVSDGWSPPRAGLVYNLSGSPSLLDGLSIVRRETQDRQISVPVIIIGSTSTDRDNKARIVNNFIHSALSNTNERLYLHIGESTAVTYEPLWGQRGADLRLWVKGGGFALGSDWSTAIERSNTLNHILELTVSPLGYGKKQRVGSAIGSIAVWRAGANDEETRGISIPISITNHFTNPIFGHSTYDNGWSVGADAIKAKNTDLQFVWEGKASCKLTRTVTGGGASGLTQSLNLGSTATFYISFRVKKEDSSAVTTADIQYIYDTTAGNITPVSLGNGWYLCFASITGIASAKATGCKALIVGQSLYVDGFQVEQGVPSPLIYGDLMDCAWTGTAHESTSTSTTGRLRVTGTEAIPVGQGTIRVAWRSTVASNVFTGDRYLFETTSGMEGKYDGANQRWYFNDATNAIAGTTNTFTAGELVLLHFVYSPGSMKIYLNGSQIATGAGYTPAAPGAYFYIGTDNAAANAATGIFHGVTTFPRAMSATEALADYNQLLPTLTAFKRIDWMPLLWTDDGDDTLDADPDSGRENYGVVLDVPGDVDAVTRYALQYTNLSSATSRLSRWILPSTTYADDVFFFETGAPYVDYTVAQTEKYYPFISTNSPISLLVNDTSGTKTVGTSIYYAGNLRIASETITVSNVASGVVETPVVSVYPLSTLPGDFTSWSETDYSSALLSANWCAILPRDTIRYDTTYTGVEINGLTVQRFSAGPYWEGTLSGVGRQINLIPEKANLLTHFHGSNTDAAATNTTVQFTQIDVTPRWGLV